MKMDWFKLRRGGSLTRAENLLTPVQLRLFFLAVAKAGPGGHACFEKGELRRLLPKVNATTGEVSEYSSRALVNMIDQLAAAGVLARVSTEQCLVLPLDLVDSYEPYPAKPCPEHGHWQHWSRDRWVEVDPATGLVAA